MRSDSDRAAAMASNRVHRLVAVISVDDQYMHLQALDGCSNCRGCAGQCNVFAGWRDQHDLLRLPLGVCSTPPRIGQRLRLWVSERSLLMQAFAGYAIPAFGLLVGSSFAWGVSAPIRDELSSTADVLVFFGAITGTFLGLRISNGDRLQRVIVHAEPLDE